MFCHSNKVWKPKYLKKQIKTYEFMHLIYTFSIFEKETNKNIIFNFVESLISLYERWVVKSPEQVHSCCSTLPLLQMSYIVPWVNTPLNSLYNNQFSPFYNIKLLQQKTNIVAKFSSHRWSLQALSDVRYDQIYSEYYQFHMLRSQTNTWICNTQNDISNLTLHNFLMLSLRIYRFVF